MVRVGCCEWELEKKDFTLITLFQLYFSAHRRIFKFETFWFLKWEGRLGRIQKFNSPGGQM